MKPYILKLSIMEEIARLLFDYLVGHLGCENSSGHG